MDGRARPDEHFRTHIDTCLGCMACVTACPSGVQFDRLVEYARPQAEAGAPRAWSDRLYRWLLFSVLPHPRRLRWIAGALRIAQRLHLQRAFRALKIEKLLPSRLAALERLTPASPGGPGPELPPVVPPAGPRRRRVGLMLGCVQRVFFRDVNASTARVLAAEGCEVLIPRRQECCGALMLHAGRVQAARAAARRLIDVFEAIDVEQIVINAAGCGSAVKDYGHLLRDDPEYAAKARAFAARSVDVSELLADLDPRAERHPVPVRVAYHDACHLGHAQRIKQPPRRVLATIPGLELMEIAESDVCCGSAGVYNLLEPGPAQALRDRKVRHVQATGARVLVSSNPGCLLQIASGLPSDTSIRTMHLVQLLDVSIQGATIPQDRNPD